MKDLMPAIPGCPFCGAAPSRINGISLVDSEPEYFACPSGHTGRLSMREWCARPGTELVELPTTAEERATIARITGVPEDQVHKLDLVDHLGTEEEKPDEPEFWGHPDQERLSATDEDEAIEAILDDMELPLPEKIIVAGFAKAEIKISGLSFLDHVLEYLDEEYGDPDGDPSEPTEAMKQAEQAFLEVVRKEYDSWACKEVCRREIIVADWVRENRPDWTAERRATQGGA